MTRAIFRPEADGFAFKNDWKFDSTETAILTTLVTDALGVIEGVLSPLIIAAEGPVLVAEASVPFIGPWLVAQTIKAQNDAIVSSITNAITAEDYGLCGGMAFASLDYWHKGWVVPRGTGESDQPQRTTPQGTTLRNYIWNRLLQSVKDNVGTFLEWMAVLHFEGGPGGTWLRDQTIQQMATLKTRIHNGTPVTVGLIGTTWNPLDNHQVLVYGYDDNPDGTLTLYVYDNNYPGVETTIRLHFDQPTLVADESNNGEPEKKRGPLRGIFCTAYMLETPPRTIVLRKGLTIAPAETGINQPVNVQITAANIGYHASPPLELVVAGDVGTPVKESALASIGEGATRKLEGNLSFASTGHHKIAAVVSLGTFAKVPITKFLPPEHDAEHPSGSVEIVGDRVIDVVRSSPCEVVNVVGGQARFSVRVDDMGSGLKFAWTVSGATVVSGANQQQVVVQLPSKEGATVTLEVTVTRPDGGKSSGKTTFQTVSTLGAEIEHLACEFSHILTKPPFHIPPGDPGPELGWVINQAQVAELEQVAKRMLAATTEASRAGKPIALSVARPGASQPTPVKLDSPVVAPAKLLVGRLAGKVID